MKRLKQELEKVQASILKMTQAHPDRMDKLKVKKKRHFLDRVLVLTISSLV